MSTDTTRDVPIEDARKKLDIDNHPDINSTSVTFENGTTENYSLVVRSDTSEWIYAEKCVQLDEEFVKEKLVSIAAAKVTHIESDRLFLFDDGAIHYGDSLLLEPASILEDSWFDNATTI